MAYLVVQEARNSDKFQEEDTEEHHKASHFGVEVQDSLGIVVASIHNLVELQFFEQLSKLIPAHKLFWLS
jgi:hypothetical protein